MQKNEVSLIMSRDREPPVAESAGAPAHWNRMARTCNRHYEVIMRANPHIIDGTAYEASSGSIGVPASTMLILCRQDTGAVATASALGSLSRIASEARAVVIAADAKSALPEHVAPFFAGLGDDRDARQHAAMRVVTGIRQRLASVAQRAMFAARRDATADAIAGNTGEAPVGTVAVAAGRTRWPVAPVPEIRNCGLAGIRTKGIDKGLLAAFDETAADVMAKVLFWNSTLMGRNDKWRNLEPDLYCDDESLNRLLEHAACRLSIIASDAAYDAVHAAATNSGIDDADARAAVETDVRAAIETETREFLQRRMLREVRRDITNKESGRLKRLAREVWQL